jgi:hypothetical protein
VRREDTDEHGGGNREESEPTAQRHELHASNPKRSHAVIVGATPSSGRQFSGLGRKKRMWPHHSFVSRR